VFGGKGKGVKVPFAAQFMAMVPALNLVLGGAINEEEKEDEIEVSHTTSTQKQGILTPSSCTMENKGSGYEVEEEEEEEEEEDLQPVATTQVRQDWAKRRQESASWQALFDSFGKDIDIKRNFTTSTRRYCANAAKTPHMLDEIMSKMHFNLVHILFAITHHMSQGASKCASINVANKLVDLRDELMSSFQLSVLHAMGSAWTLELVMANKYNPAPFATSSSSTSPPPLTTAPATSEEPPAKKRKCHHKFTMAMRDGSRVEVTHRYMNEDEE